jgi:sugar O-acyltransferase (sialic acid O-acetyltransferase NeuD family)
MSIKKIVIIGARGSGKDVLATLLRCNKKSKKYEILGFIDDDPKLKNKKIMGKKVLGGLEWFNHKRESVSCVVAIGDSLIRKNIVKRLEEENVRFFSLVDPSVIYDDKLQVGNGTIIQAGSIINPDTKIGNHVFINLDSTIGHDCLLEDFTTISTGVHINGNCFIYEGAYIGSGTVTKEDTKIGKWSIIGAGSVVVNDVKANSVYKGTPSKFYKNINSNNRPKL